MTTDTPLPVVRAKANKISVTETYSYHADIGADTFISFKEGGGEIKVEFLYDGEKKDWRRRIHLAIRTIFEENKRVRAFKKWAGAYKVWRSLARVGDWLVTKLLGRWNTQKSFGIAAITDARKHAGREWAQAGHLTLQGYRQPRFLENWPEHEHTPLNIPIADLDQKLKQSLKHELICKYPLRALEQVPVRLCDVRLVDESKERADQQNGSKSVAGMDRFEELHSGRDEVLLLEIELEFDGSGLPRVEPDGKIPRIQLEQWWEKGEKLRCGEGKEDRQDDEEVPGHPFEEQVRCMEGLCEVDKLKQVHNQLARRGGYLLVKLNKQDLLETLKERLLQAAFSPTRFIPLKEPYEHGFENETLNIVPVPLVRQDRTNDDSPDLWIRSNYLAGSETPGFEMVDVENPGELAKALTAMANSAGGSVRSTNFNNHDKEKVARFLRDALQQCQPGLTWQGKKPDIEFDLDNRGEGVIYVRAASNTIHRAGRFVYKWEEGGIRSLTTEEIYDLIDERCSLDYPLVMIPPAVSFAYLQWPNFDVREAQGVRYDPERKAVEWQQPLEFQQLPDHRFKLKLPLEINRAVELYPEQKIEGQLQLNFKEILFSGLQVHYFDAVGDERPRVRNKLPVVEKVSKVHLNFSLKLRPIFRRQKSHSQRQVEFEGILLNTERIKDIQGILADLGFENISTRRELKAVGQEISVLFFSRLLTANEDTDYSYILTARRPGVLELEMEVTGQPVNISRMRKDHDRQDQMPVRTGKVRIIIDGRVDGEGAEEAGVLLNRLQQLLKERFSRIRHQVA